MKIFNYQDNWYQCIENTGYGWINIYNRNTISTSKENCYIITGVSVFKTKESAISYKNKDKEYIDTIKIEWEE